MATNFISFKNVGVQQFAAVNLITLVSQSIIPFGLKTPLRLGDEGEELFKMNMSLADQVNDNMRNLILTNHGERLGLYDYGANLIPLLTEFSNFGTFQEEAMLRINTAVSKFMRYVQLDGFAAEPSFEDNRFTGVMRVMIQYSVPMANINTRLLEVTLRVIG